MVEEGTLTPGQVRPLITVDYEDIEKFAQKIAKENLSARSVERLIQEYRGNVTRNTPVISEAAREYQKQLRHYLQTRVKIDGSKITINYVDEDDLERIIDLLTEKVKANDNAEKLKKLREFSTTGKFNV
jgi:ParB family chromosome partitioning protein